MSTPEIGDLRPTRRISGILGSTTWVGLVERVRRVTPTVKTEKVWKCSHAHTSPSEARECAGDHIRTMTKEQGGSDGSADE